MSGAEMTNAIGSARSEIGGRRKAGERRRGRGCRRKSRLCRRMCPTVRHRPTHAAAHRDRVVARRMRHGQEVRMVQPVAVGTVLARRECAVRCEGRQ